jgi:hypothetical protein
MVTVAAFVPVEPGLNLMVIAQVPDPEYGTVAPEQESTVLV